MEINDNVILLILGFGILLLLFTMTCKKENFITDIFASDYTYRNTLDNPFNLRYNQPTRDVPVDESTSEHPYAGLSGYEQRPSCDNMY